MRRTELALDKGLLVPTNSYGTIDISWRLSVTDSINGRLVIQAVAQRIANQTDLKISIASEELLEMSRTLLQGALKLEAEAESTVDRKSRDFIGVFDCLVYGHQQALEKRVKLVEILAHVLVERLRKDRGFSSINTNVNMQYINDKDQDKDLILIQKCALRISKLSEKGFPALMSGIDKIGLEKPQLGLFRRKIRTLLYDDDAKARKSISLMQMNNLLQVYRSLLLMMIANSMLSAIREKDNIICEINQIWKSDIVLEFIQREYGQHSVPETEWTHFISQSNYPTDTLDEGMDIIVVTSYVESVLHENVSTWKPAENKGTLIQDKSIPEPKPLNEKTGKKIHGTNCKQKDKDDLGKVQILNTELLKFNDEKHLEEKQDVSSQYGSDDFVSDCDSIFEIVEKSSTTEENGTVNRKTTITFAEKATVFEIPKYTDEEKHQCFYSSSEIHTLLEDADECSFSEEIENLNSCDENEMIIGTVSGLL